MAALRSWRPDLTVEASEGMFRAPGPTLDVAAVFTAAGLARLTGPQVPAPSTTITSTPTTTGTPFSGAQFTIAGGTTRRLRTAGAVRLTGRLTGPDGRALPAAVVTVETRRLVPKSQLVNGPRLPLRPALTDSAGRFYALVPKGPSRVVLLSYGGTTERVNVLVPAQITARAAHRALRNGQRMTIRGRVAGPIPDGGAPIALEARNRGSWVPVATTRRWVKTSNSGDFTLSYRFLRAYTATRYRFRVVAGEDSSFPYTRGTSRTIHVHVRP
jgi:hypothetical protein